MGETERIEQLELELREEKDKNINLRFDTMDKNFDDLRENVNLQFTDIKTLLHKTIDQNAVLVEELRGRLNKVEERQRNCPITPIKLDMKRIAKETSFIRSLFSNPWKGALIVTFWIILIVTLVLIFGPTSVFETLLKLKEI